jgi:predicted RNase H-like HicB family nuclease
MTDPKTRVEVNVEYSNGREEDEAGNPYYVACCDDLMFTTEGETFEQLLDNIRECLELNLAVGDPVAAFNVVPNPRVRIILELPENYAKTA